MKKTNTIERRNPYSSPEVEILSLGAEKVFAASGTGGIWDDADNSSADFSIGSVYYDEFE